MRISHDGKEALIKAQHQGNSDDFGRVNSRSANSFLTALLVYIASLVCETSVVYAEIQTPLADPRHRIVVEGHQAQRWKEGSYTVWVIEGPCRLRQGNVVATAEHAVLWVDSHAPQSGKLKRAIAYLEGKVTVDYGHYGHAHESTGKKAQTVRDKTWLGRLQTIDDVDVLISSVSGKPQVRPAIIQRGINANAPRTQTDHHVKPVQFTQSAPGDSDQPTRPFANVSARSIIIQSRSNVPMQFEAREDPQRKEMVLSFTSGVNIVVAGIEGLEGYASDKIDVEADNMVVWTEIMDTRSVATGSLNQSANSPLEFYMSGNIVFREGDRVIYAQRMYYNVRERYGVILDAEILTPVPEYQGLLRIKAEVLQQVDRHNFLAYQAAATSSRLGEPRYWFQSEAIELQDIQTPLINPFTGETEIDPVTGDPAVNHELLASSRNNFLYVGGYPVFYWPVLATDLRKPTYYVDQVRLKSDSVFGTQVLVDWDVYQLLGWRQPPQGTDWTVSTDYLSERGPALGTHFEYERDQFFGLIGPASGMVDAWGIYDSGLDNLGFQKTSGDS